MWQQIEKWERDRARHTSREEARETLERNLASEERLLAQIEAERELPAFARKAFTTTDPNYLIDYYRHCLRWIDCAPDGANHLVAPLQGRYGVPLGKTGGFEVGPGASMRAAMERRHGRPWIETARAIAEGRAA